MKIIIEPTREQLKIYLGQKVRAMVCAYSYHNHFTLKIGVIEELDNGEIGVSANEFYSDIYSIEIEEIIFIINREEAGHLLTTMEAEDLILMLDGPEDEKLIESKEAIHKLNNSIIDKLKTLLK
jgi:hypothetical protein